MTGWPKRAWHKVHDDPAFLRAMNGWMVLFWIVMTPVSMFMGWLSLVEYVSALSIWALVSSHWAAWQAARVEEEQDE